MGLWIVPTGITIFCLWLATDTSNTLPRSFGDAIIGGASAAVNMVVAILIFIFSWLIYFTVV